MLRSNKRRKSKRQKAWEYMRRNRFFVISDLLILLEMRERTLMRFIRQLEHAGYIKCIKKSKSVRERTYKLIRNTGVIAPQWLQKQQRLYDPNIKEMKLKDASMKLPVVPKKVEMRIPNPTKEARW